MVSRLCAGSSARNHFLPRLDAKRAGAIRPSWHLCARSEAHWDRGRFPRWVCPPEHLNRLSLASAIHRRNARKIGPFVAINCNAIPENLPESELLGSENGALRPPPGPRFSSTRSVCCRCRDMHFFCVFSGNSVSSVEFREDPALGRRLSPSRCPICGSARWYRMSRGATGGRLLPPLSKLHQPAGTLGIGGEVEFVRLPYTTMRRALTTRKPHRNKMLSSISKTRSTWLCRTSLQSEYRGVRSPTVGTGKGR